MTIKELESKWNKIESYSGGFLLVTDDHPLDFHIGYQDSEQKSFVVLNSGEIDGLHSSKAITAECVGVDQQFILKFVLNYPSLDEIFVKLCWDLMESSRTSPNPVEQICTQYSKWMQLLQKATDESLSYIQQKGLAGELLYLLDILNKLEPMKALRAWVGPEGSDQDFSFPHSWAEVKAVSIAATDVQISSLQQLDREDDGELVVYFMDRTTNEGAQTVSLPKLIQQIEKKLPTVFLRDSFSCKLAQYGYFDHDVEKYSPVYYRVDGCRKYRVGDDFPQLKRTNVPSAVVNAKYRIDLLMLEEWRT